MTKNQILQILCYSISSIEHLDFSSSFNINELDIEPFEQIKHSLYETQNFIEMTPPKIQPEDVNDYMVRLLSENTSSLLPFLNVKMQFYIRRSYS